MQYCTNRCFGNNDIIWYDAYGFRPEIQCVIDGGIREPSEMIAREVLIGRKSLKSMKFAPRASSRRFWVL